MRTFKDALIETKELEFPIGEDKNGKLIISDLREINHLIISGATGVGKSEFVHSLLLTLMQHNSPDNLRFVLCDTKFVEFSQYNGIGHLYVPVATSEKICAGALYWVAVEAQKRLRMFSECGVRDIITFNAIQEFSLPRVLVVIDDIQTLLRSNPALFSPITQTFSIARTVGIHFVVAAQSVTDKNVKSIASQFMNRLVFATSAANEFRFMTRLKNYQQLPLDGTALFCMPASAIKVQTIMANPQDSYAMLKAVKEEAEAEYSDEILAEIEKAAEKDKNSKDETQDGGDRKNDYDELLPQAVEVILETKTASVSLLQRRLKQGYARAARLIDQLEEMGVVGPYEGSNPRQILLTKQQWQEVKRSAGV